MQTLEIRRLVRAAALVLLTGVMPAAAQDSYRHTVVVTAATTPVELGSTERAIAVSIVVS